MGKRIFFQIYPGFLIIIALTIIPTAWFATRIFREFHIESLRDEVLVRANMMNGRVARAIGGKEFIPTCESIAKTADARVTVIAANGTVLYDSEGDYKSMPDHSVARPEMKAALIDRKNGVAIRYSSTLLKDMLYAAEPLLNAKGELIGLAFDGNWEAMSGDIAFEPELQRTINVDIRYVLFIIDKYAGAKYLVDEMTLKK